MLKQAQTDQQGAEPQASCAETVAPMHRACSIAIVGGGVSGLSCAHKLLQLLPNARVNVIDMGRSGPGGRQYLMPPCATAASGIRQLAYARF